MSTSTSTSSNKKTMASLSSDDDDELFLLSIPSTPFLLVICPFLSPLDILNLRLTCRRIYELLHNNDNNEEQQPDDNDNDESDELWKRLLQQNFQIEKEEGFYKTLEIAPLSSLGEVTMKSIFGVHPRNAIKKVSSPFEAWKCWIKCSRRFYSDEFSITDCRLKEVILIHNQQQKRRHIIHGPYFLRAATLWSKILTWLETPALSGPVGSRVKSLLSRGIFYQDWSFDACDELGIEASQAVYAFCGGQVAFQIVAGLGDFELACDGLLGGYHAYNYYSCTHLSRPICLVLSNRDTPRIIIATDAFSAASGIQKMFCINSNTGMVELHYDQNEIRPAINIQRIMEEERTSDGVGRDAILLWLEEYASRLSTGQIGAGPMGPTPHDHQAILLYSRFRMTDDASPAGVVTEDVHNVSRAVTRGVEVVASSVYTPQAGQGNMGFIYNIRIRLLTPQDDYEDYVSAADRGFETCQLQSRHWRISNQETGNVDQVDGDGVISMCPLLREGGYTKGGDDFEGTFSYTSCTAPMRGSFSGHLRFVPGSLRSPTGPAFDVRLNPFALDNNPTFLY